MVGAFQYIAGQAVGLAAEQPGGRGREVHPSTGRRGELAVGATGRRRVRELVEVVGTAAVRGKDRQACGAEHRDGIGDRHAGHHGEVEQHSVDAVLAQIADSISGGRPGARRESLETYVKRLQRLEEICTAMPGVEKTFAMQAGREVRVMVKPEDVDDISAQVIARDIAKQVEEELQYPGQIKITVVRETRAVEYAK